MKPTTLIVASAAGLLCAGCLERKVSITSEPPGALVYANDVELGRTPVEADFTFYGKYDVRLELEGYEPLRTQAKANAPLYEIPPFDLVAMAMPWDIHTNIKWHFVLQPALETTMESRVLEDEVVMRAKELREKLGAEEKVEDAAATNAADKPAEAPPEKAPEKVPESTPAEPNE